MMSVEIEKIPGGFRVDGLELLRGKCGCTSLAKCCYSWSKIKRRDSTIEFEAKMTTPDTSDVVNWGYVVKKNGFIIKVKVEDARDKEIYSGFIPPPAEAWQERGWEITEKDGDRIDGTVWKCAMCKWLYKEDMEKISFEDLPEDWKCPKCGASKSEFERIG